MTACNFNRRDKLDFFSKRIPPFLCVYDKENTSMFLQYPNFRLVILTVKQNYKGITAPIIFIHPAV